MLEQKKMLMGIVFLTHYKMFGFKKNCLDFHIGDQPLNFSVWY
jgi:hypothetical protein